ncbi:MAG: response regulator transcription factor [Saprospiraceae bacterium]|nr:response regulator transcription factor [Saprospiraceae bacterium]MCF8251292.1 response regulator transcription factor [Saprospiraceae bacterium]MCF8280817.1 response regulator transcription factor [Bacteroidales bacterium]MCF8311829.1 response regulator transcription factor [Saprospiraceae bacterium]MCF8441970.1 response regulator transcription factor [Saprospiraceae bacterium]
MPKILYVEDEPFLGKIVKESLESRQFEVRLVADGGKVMPAFEQFQPDACVLDVMLPNRDGFSLGEEIRQKHPTVPILFLTAKVQTEDVLQGFRSGGNDYVRKPFSMEELIVRLQNLLALRSNTQANNGQDGIAIGSFRFFPNRQELRLGDTPARLLSHRETELLALLASPPNANVARKDILDKLWGNDSFFNSRNLDVYVSKLREYLREDASVQLLTLKGVGYRLVC